MTDTPCPREGEVLAAAATDTFSDELRTHVVDCTECTELVMVAGFMNRGALELGGVGPLPDAGYVWWRANLEQRELRSRRATGIISLVQRVGVVVAGLVAFMLVRSLVPDVKTWLVGLASSVQISSLSGDMASPFLVVLVSLGLLAAPSVFNLYGTSTRD